jgi:hypothetical protein
MIPDTDKAYIAGLFDGEGSIHMRRGMEKRKSIRVNLDTECQTVYVYLWK